MTETTPADPDDEILALTALVDTIGDEAQRLREQVKRCRDAGASWAQIGLALGTSRQAAQERFGKKKEPEPHEADFARRIVRLRSAAANKRAQADGLINRARQLEDQAAAEERRVGLRVHSETNIERID